MLSSLIKNTRINNKGWGLYYVYNTITYIPNGYAPSDNESTTLDWRHFLLSSFPLFLFFFFSEFHVLPGYTRTCNRAFCIVHLSKVHGRCICTLHLDRPLHAVEIANTDTRSNQALSRFNFTLLFLFCLVLFRN